MNQPGHGNIAAFYHQNELCYAIITDNIQGLCLVITSSQEEFQLPEKRFVTISNSVYDTSNPAMALSSFLDSVDLAASSIQADKIPDLLLPHGNSFGFEQICSILGYTDDASRFALYQVMRKHPEVFAFKHDSFLIRNTIEQQNYLVEQGLKAEQKLFLQKVQRFVTESMVPAQPGAVADSSWQDEDFKSDFLSRFKADLIEKKDNSDLLKLIRSCAKDLPWDELIYRLRLSLGDINPLTDRVLATSGLAVKHTCAAPGEYYSPFTREDKTTLQVFSIDDEDTLDIDDAISWEELESGYRLGVHISDVTARIEPESELFREAKLRVSSLYLPTENVPMFPEGLTKDILSLRADSIQPALSLFIDFDRDFQQTNSRFTLTNICITKNYSYKEVDRLFQQKPFSTLKQLQSKLRQFRNKESDNSQYRFSFQINASPPEIELKRIDNESPARNLVREMMILYNRSFAEYTFKYQLPAIYRNIEQYLQDAKDPDSAVINSTVYLSTKPDYHPGIGAEAYMHASSPIRRFTDLVNQYQVCFHLGSGQPLFDVKQLQNKILGIEKILLLQREVINFSNRYWFLAYLKRHHLQQALKASIVKHVKHGFIAELHSWNRKVNVICDAYYRVGEEVLLIPMQVNPEGGFLRAEVIQ